MKLPAVSLTVAILAGTAIADSLHNGLLSPVHALNRRTTLEERDSYYESVAEIERRQNMNMSGLSTAKEDALAVWNATTATGCSDALNALGGRASNPAGMAACFNLPIFDMATGSFEAEVRMYRIASPVDPWTNIAVEDMTVAITFPNAIRVESSRQTLLKRRSALSWPPVKSEDGALVTRQLAQLDPVSIQAYLGQIDPNKMKPKMSRDELRSLLLPVIILSSRQQPETTANITTTEAAFVSGALSDKDFITVPGSSATPTPFVLPGVTLGIFPIGLIITTFWALVFLTIVGLGTIGRIQFRDQYRQRMKREIMSGVKTI